MNNLLINAAPRERCAAYRVLPRLMSSVAHSLSITLRGAMVLCVLAVATLASGIAIAERITTGDIHYDIDSVPAWVAQTEVVVKEEQEKRGTGNIQHRLFDFQVGLAAGSQQRYVHHAYTVLTHNAVEQAGNIPIEFSPAFEQLTVHQLAVIRDGKRMDKLRSARVELLRRELGREQLMYDGRVTADLLLDDVRVGDTVDIAYTITGFNEVLGEKFNMVFPLAFSDPVDDLRVRVLYPATRILQYTVIKAAVTPRVMQEGSHRELSVQRRNVAAIDLEPSTPIEDMPFPRLRITEYASWGEVAQWADQLYRVPDDLSPALRQIIEDIKKQRTGDADAVRRALKFVQNEVRYVGVEIGESSFRPSHPNQILERRYGDCKDKAVLLSALLRGLGYSAYPALVSPWLGHNAATLTPMPHAFNHVIVMTELGGQRYWLDATRTFQEGTLERISNPLLHLALVTGQAATALTPIEPAKDAANQVEVRYQFEIHDYREPVSLAMSEIYTGIMAESARAQIATHDHRNLLDARQQELQRVYPGVSAIGELAVSDDIDRNQLTLISRYSLPQFFESQGDKGLGHLYAALIYALTKPPAKLTRSAPVALPHPMSVRMQFTVDFPNDVALRSIAPNLLADDNVEFSVFSSYKGKRLSVEYKLSTRRDQVPVSQLQSYASVLGQIRERLVYRFPVAHPQTPMAARGDKSQATGDDDTRIAVAIAREYEGEAHTLTAQIESGTVDKQRIAQALVDRAIAYSRLGRRDGALADLQRAMGLDPTVARPYVVRAEVYTGAGDFDHALADFATAVKLDPQVDVAQSRGQAYFLKGDYRAAQADLKRASEAASGEKQLHLLIWLYLATQRVGEDARALVSGIRARADLSQWPGPAVMMLLGETKPEDMLSSAWSFDRKTELLQRCEAYFFLGQYRLLKGDPEQARAAFEVSAATGMTHYVEYSYSKLELSRMGTSSTAKRAAK